tara:strand:- start:532 stop:780 length:249 start_codon:yes stop_codon:yes gene_type:complete
MNYQAFFIFVLCLNVIVFSFKLHSFLKKLKTKKAIEVTKEWELMILNLQIENLISNQLKNPDEDQLHAILELKQKWFETKSL